MCVLKYGVINAGFCVEIWGNKCRCVVLLSPTISASAGCTCVGGLTGWVMPLKATDEICSNCGVCIACVSTVGLVLYLLLYLRQCNYESIFGHLQRAMMRYF